MQAGCSQGGRFVTLVYSDVLYYVLKLCVSRLQELLVKKMHLIFEKLLTLDFSHVGIFRAYWGKVAGFH